MVAVVAGCTTGPLVTEPQSQILTCSSPQREASLRSSACLGKRRMGFADVSCEIRMGSSDDRASLTRVVCRWQLRARPHEVLGLLPADVHTSPGEVLSTLICMRVHHCGPQTACVQVTTSCTLANAGAVFCRRFQIDPLSDFQSRDRAVVNARAAVVTASCQYEESAVTTSLCVHRRWVH
jgi:hypothetical protein